LAVLTKEAVAIRGQNLVEQRGGVAPTLVGNESPPPIQLPFPEPVAGKSDAPFTLSVFSLGGLASSGFGPGVVNILSVVGPPMAATTNTESSRKQTAYQHGSSPRADTC
jgi:hypothetical protein